MFARRYFAPRYFAPRYFPPVVQTARTVPHVDYHRVYGLTMDAEYTGGMYSLNRRPTTLDYLRTLHDDRTPNRSE